jgi:hypothetical protein
MKNLVTVVLFAVSLQIANAQTSVKLYANVQPNKGIFANNISFASTENTTPLLLSMINPYSISINKKLKKNRYLELEIGQIRFKKANITNAILYNSDSLFRSSYKKNIQSASCRIEYGKQLLTDANNKWTLLLGQSFQPNYTRHTAKAISNMHSSSSTQFDVSYHVIPHIQYMGKKRFGVDVNFPIYLFKVGLLASNIENPALQEAQRKWTTFNFDAFDGSRLLSMRVGAVYKL